jgi:hypothetical protein
VRFANAAQVVASERHAECRNDHEGDPPAGQAGKDTAEQRRKAGSRRPRNHGQRQSPPERLAVKEITRDGTRQDRGRASSQRLNDPAQNQHGQCIGHCANHAAGGEDGKASQNYRLAAEAIG